MCLSMFAGVISIERTRLIRLCIERGHAQWKEGQYQGSTRWCRKRPKCLGLEVRWKCGKAYLCRIGMLNAGPPMCVWLSMSSARASRSRWAIVQLVIQTVHSARSKVRVYGQLQTSARRRDFVLFGASHECGGLLVVHLVIGRLLLSVRQVSLAFSVNTDQIPARKLGRTSQRPGYNCWSTLPLAGRSCYDVVHVIQHLEELVVAILGSVGNHDLRRIASGTLETRVRT